MDARSGRHLGVELQKAMGLEGQRITHMTIDVPVEGAATVTITAFVDESIVPVIQTYQLLAEVTGFESTEKEYRRPA